MASNGIQESSSINPRDLDIPIHLAMSSWITLGIFGSQLAINYCLCINFTLFQKIFVGAKVNSCEI